MGYGSAAGRHRLTAPSLLAPVCAALSRTPTAATNTPPAPPPRRQGVWEKDEIRKDDSFVAFEEVLQLAKEQQARGGWGVGWGLGVRVGLR